MKTFEQRIMKHLENGWPITNGQANAMLHSTEGGRTIRRLRQGGVPIKDEWRENRLRKGHRVKVYWLDRAEWRAILKQRKEFDE